MTNDLIKTKITDLLDAHNIPYRVLPHSEPVFTVETAAAQRGVVKEECVSSQLNRGVSIPRCERRPAKPAPHLTLRSATLL